ncbi:hypothetical protein HN803_01500 [candidate division WWE3 bacterium]|nr:hypothetical protein [candidate division WWE3 bacterium]
MSFKKAVFLVIASLPGIALNMFPFILFAAIGIIVGNNVPPIEVQTLSEVIQQVVIPTMMTSAMLTIAALSAILVYLLINAKLFVIVAVVYTAACVPIALIVHQVMEENPQS